MFGRLSEEKRVEAIALICETTDNLAELFINWTSNEDWDPNFTCLTPKKAYMDELYILCSMPTCLPYLAWRKKRPDAYEDVSVFLEHTFSTIHEKYGSDWPFRIKTENPSTSLPTFIDLMDERLKEYEIAWHDELVNREAEIRKSRYKLGGSHDGDLLASAMANTPFKDLVILRLYDVASDEENAGIEYGGFGYQVMPAMTKQGDTFLHNLKRI